MANDVPIEPRVTPPIIGPGHTYASVTDKISSVVLSGTPRLRTVTSGLRSSSSTGGCGVS